MHAVFGLSFLFEAIVVVGNGLCLDRAVTAFNGEPGGSDESLQVVSL